MSYQKIRGQGMPVKLISRSMELTQTNIFILRKDLYDMVWYDSRCAPCLANFATPYFFIIAKALISSNFLLKHKSIT